MNKLINTSFHNKLISLENVLRIQVLLFKSIQKWRIIFLLLVVDLIFIRNQNNFELRVNFASYAIWTYCNSTVLTRSHTYIVHIEQVIQTLIQHFKAIKYDYDSLLHTSDDLAQNYQSSLLTKIACKITPLKCSISLI